MWRRKPARQCGRSSTRRRESSGRSMWCPFPRAVWRSYRWLVFLGHDGSLAEEDLGLLHSSAAESMQDLIQKRLRQRDELTDTLNPNRVIQNWPPALPEWTTEALRDTVYASPAF